MNPKKKSAYAVTKLKDFSANSLHKAFIEAKSAFNEELLSANSEATWKAFRDRWMARKNGMLTQINDLWLKAAPKERKGVVGQLVNELKQFVDQEISKAR